MNVKYRQYKTRDQKIVTELIKQLYKEDPGDQPASNKHIQKTLTILPKHKDKGTILIFELGKQLIGYSILINYWSNEFGGNIVFIDELFIKKEFRGQGIGTNFIKYLMKNKFGNSVLLQIEVTPNNKKAKKLYEKLGFKLQKNSTLMRKI